ncbi:DnaJ domain-containing protein [Photobacterium sp. R1]
MNTILIISTLCFAALNALLLIKRKKDRAEHNSLAKKLALVQSQLEELQAKDKLGVSLGEVDYFKSRKDKLMFLLLEVDGKRRNQLLGITPNMYDDGQAAKKWYKSLSLQVHPDKNPGDENAAKAFDKLNELYTMMTL